VSAPVKVQIFGQTYAVRGELDEAYVQKLAAYVDEKMRAIADATATVDTQKLAVLAALAIADELHSTQKERGDQEELLREQAERRLPRFVDGLRHQCFLFLWSHLRWLGKPSIDIRARSHLRPIALRFSQDFQEASAY